MNQIYIFGHRKPDTDSVTSSIALSYLKNKIGLNTKPVILDPINKETEFVLKRFNIKEPEFLNDVKLQIKDVNYYKDFYINSNRTIKQVYDAMAKKNTTGVPIVDDDNNFLGIITSKMIGNEIINGNFSSLNTSYENIVDTLDGEEILKFNNEISGNIILPALRSSKIISDISFKNDDILILGDRYSVLEYAIKSKVKLIILVGNTEIKIEHLMLASKNRVNIIRTSHDLFHASKLITLSNYIKDLLTKERAVSFSLDDYYDEFKSKAISFGYNNYPIVNSDNKCKGLIRITDINNINKKQVILVDHNESSQSVYGLDEAEIVEIVDHHRIGDLTTNKPINFRNMTVGSTNTIIYLMFIEKNIDIPSDIAGIMLSGIISDTLKFTSPTTTDMDKIAALRLSMLAKVNIDEYALEMFKYGTNLEGRTIQEVINTDIKVYNKREFKFCVSQITTLNSDLILDDKDKYIEVLDNMQKEKDFYLCLICVTDILKGGSYIVCNSEAENLIGEAFSITNFYQGCFVPDCLSRKNQVVPKVMSVIK